MAINQPIMTRASGLSTVDATTQYLQLMCEQEAALSAANVDYSYRPIPTAGSFTAMKVKLSAAPGVGCSRRFRLYKNGSVQAEIDITISGAETTGSTTGVVSVVAGDRISIQTDSSGAGAGATAYILTTFVSTTEKEVILLSRIVTNNSLNKYSALTGLSNGSDVYAVMPTPGTFSKLYVWMMGAPGAGKNFAYTLRYDGATVSDITCTIADANVAAHDTAHSLAIVAGQDVHIIADPTGTPTAYQAMVGIVFSPDTDNLVPLLATTYNLDAANVRYQPIIDQWVGGSVADSSCNLMMPACTLKDFYVELKAAPSVGDKYTFVVRKNSATPAEALTVEISELNIAGNDTIHSTVIEDEDESCIQVTPDSSPDVTKAAFGLVMDLTEGSPPAGGNSLATKMLAGRLI